MKVTNVHNVPQPLVTLAEADHYSKGAADYSVTELIPPPRIARLRKKHEASLQKDVTDMFWSLLGSAVHVILERGKTDGWISEERLFAQIDGVILSGAIDLQEQTPEGVILHDFKVTSVWAVMNDKIEWEQQLNIYKLLVEKVKGQKVIGLRICAILRDFNRHDVGKDGYPKAPIHVVEIPMWDDSRVEQYVMERLNLHRDSKVQADFDEQLPLCSDKERWMSETTFAVKREGRKTAIRVLKDVHEANELATKEKGYVEIRRGEPRRCTGNYCGVADFCDQYQGERKNEDRE